MPDLTYEQMAEAINKGGVVNHRGKIIRTVEEIPGALFGDDEASHQAALDALDAQLRPLQTERAQLEERKQAAAVRAQAQQSQQSQGQQVAGQQQSGQQAQGQQAQPEPQNAQGQPVYEKAELESWEDDDLKELARHYELDLRQFRTKPNLIAGLLKAQEEARRRA